MDEFTKNKEIIENVLDTMDNAEALLIVPPFAGLEWPSIGVHLLQSVVVEQKITARVLYANLLFANLIGEFTYRQLSCNYNTTPELIGERLFARAAYGTSPLGLADCEEKQNRFSLTATDYRLGISLDELLRYEEIAYKWICLLSDAIASLNIKVVGSSTSFEQTCSSIALLKSIKNSKNSKENKPITILGGANCEGEMAKGLLSSGVDIDYIFSGESESTFMRFMTDYKRNVLPNEKIISGEPCEDMDTLPCPDYAEYFQQWNTAMQASSMRVDDLSLYYETSRGCWWGAKHHCTFCGLNGKGMKFREKTPAKAYKDIKLLTETAPTNRLRFSDNIMPLKYFDTLLPDIEESMPKLDMFYEEKSNLSLKQLQILKSAGVNFIQAGVESLSSNVLKLMDKGVSGSQNIQLIRYAMMSGVSLSWNYLHSFPDEKPEDYERLLDLIPFMHHLTPPEAMGKLRIDRFGLYHSKPDKYGVKDIKPFDAYYDIFPEPTNVDNVAYYFNGDYKAAMCDDATLKREFEAVIRNWQKVRDIDRDKRPKLFIKKIAHDKFILVDTRGVEGNASVSTIDRRQAIISLLGAKSARYLSGSKGAIKWVLEKKLCVWIDGKLTPLATCSISLINEFLEDIRLTQSKQSEIRYAELTGT